MRKPKIIELLIDESEELFGVQAISLVSNPALERGWGAFSKDKFLSLAKIDEDKRTLVGPALIPEKQIPRHDENEGEYLVFFSKETISKAQELFMNSLKGNNSTVEHTKEINGVSVIESWIKEDKNDKGNLYGFSDIPLGSWFVKMKVYNDEIWKQVKAGVLRGFSIEGFFIDKAINFKQEKEKDILDLADECVECDENIEVLDKIKGVLMDAELKPDITLDGTPVYRDIEKAELYGQLFFDCVGTHSHDIDGQTFYMGCKSHKEIMDKMRKKVGYKKTKYKNKRMTEKELAKYPWSQCIKDQMKEYGNKETAQKVCAAIKNRTVNR